MRDQSNEVGKGLRLGDLLDLPGNRMPNDFELERITRDPEICEGKPTIRGMRITVSVILRMLAAGHTREDVLEAYPELEEEDVRQSLQFAARTVSGEEWAVEGP